MGFSGACVAPGGAIANSHGGGDHAQAPRIANLAQALFALQKRPHSAAPRWPWTHVAYTRGAGGASAKPRSGMLGGAKYSYGEAIEGTEAHGGRTPREPPLPDTHPAAGPQADPAYSYNS